MSKIAQYDVAGRPITCESCGNDQFEVRKAQLNTALASLFDLDFLNPSAWTLTCSHCTRIAWFGEEPAIAYR